MCPKNDFTRKKLTVKFQNFEGKASYIVKSEARKLRQVEVGNKLLRNKFFARVNQMMSSKKPISACYVS